MAKITKRYIEQLKPTGSDLVVWDDGLPGFGLRMKPSGYASFIVQYRNRLGRSRRITLGSVQVVTPKAARGKAKELLEKARLGCDPKDERDLEKGSLTVSELSDIYLKRHANTKKKASSAAEDKRNLKNHVRSRLGSRKVLEISRSDIVKLHHDMRKTPGAANRVLSLLSKIFNLAERWGYRTDGTNPCRHVERYPERKMERFLSQHELASLGAVMARAEKNKTENEFVIAAIRLLILTGARVSEILGLKWSDVDFEKSVLRLPDSKTGAKVIYLSAPALEVLSNLESDPESKWVIQGRDEGKHLVNLRKPWYRLRKEATVELWRTSEQQAVAGLVVTLADKLGTIPTFDQCIEFATSNDASKMELPTGLSDVRLHDLRHSYASMGAASGLSLPMIGALLGHTQASTTSRYAHLAADPLHQATNSIGERIGAAMNAESELDGSIVELKRSKPNGK